MSRLPVRRLHLAELAGKCFTDGQALTAAFDAHLHGHAQPLDAVDGLEVDDRIAVDLREAVRVQLLQQALERQADQRLGWPVY